MRYTLIITEDAKIDIASFSYTGDKVGAKKVNVLLDELREHPYTGTGKPEPLRGTGLVTGLVVSIKKTD